MIGCDHDSHCFDMWDVVCKSQYDGDCWVCGVTEMPCEAPEAQRHGHRKDCPEPFLYKGQCQFECDDGYKLPATDSVAQIKCIARVISGRVAVEWDNSPTSCIGQP